MRHGKKTVKLGRTAAHRNALLSNLVCSLIEHHRIKTTLAKAKAVRPLAEKMVTLGKKGDLHARRIAASYLKQAEAVKALFEKIAPAAAERVGGYTRIIKIGARQSDSAPMAFIEWVDSQSEPAETPVEPAKTTAKSAKTAAKPAKTTVESVETPAEPDKKPAAKTKPKTKPKE